MRRLQTVVTTDNGTPKEYVGSPEADIKLRLANHRHSFRNKKLRNSTRLSAYVHELEDQNQSFDIKWSIQAKMNPYVCGSRKCNLCLTEKYEILKMDPKKSLNKRNEIANKCQHRAKFKLCNIR